MLKSEGLLEVCMVFSQEGRPKIVTQIIANHSDNPECRDLPLKKNCDLKAILSNRATPFQDQRMNGLMRKGILDSFGDFLHYKEGPIEVNREDVKRLYGKLAKQFPVYALFQDDRKNRDRNRDRDSEVQDSLKVAVRQILQEEKLQELF